MRKFYNLLLSLVLLGCSLFSAHTLAATTSNGAISTTAGIITEQTELFILDTFSSANSPEELAGLVLQFSLENFIYDSDSITIPQTADTNRFISKNDFHGVCLDFSAFVKTVYQVISRHKRWQNVGCHVVLGHNLSSREGHAANYITVKNPDETITIYEFDLTRDLNLHQAGKPVQGISYSIVVNSPEAVQQTILNTYSEFYGDPYVVIT